MSVTPYQHTGKSKKEEVEMMFNNIAPRYDLLNHVLSMGIDKGWRKKAVRLLKNCKHDLILDVATGTADFAIAACSLQPQKIEGVDIADKMLEEGRIKVKKLGLDQVIHLTHADSEKLPYADNTFDAITVGFGVRNFENLENGLQEMLRVLKPGGTALVLEFSNPEAFPVKQLYRMYFNHLLPVIGRIISKDHAAYRYLPQSVKAFPSGKQFLEIYRHAGFSNTSQVLLTFGIASIYIGKKTALNRITKHTRFTFMKTCILMLVVFAVPACLMAQQSRVQNLPKYDKQKIHFGFLLGINVTDFSIKRKGNFNSSDSLYSVESAKQSGFNLGIVSNLRMGNHFDLRFLPDLSFAQRNLEYAIFVNGVRSKKVIKKVESTFLEFPLEVKFKSERINNYRIYVLAGGKYGIDMVSQAKVKNKDKEYVKLKRNDFGYSIGAGVDCYMELFKFSIEMKMYQGLNNLLVSDPSIYSRTLDKLNSKIFSINLTFE